MEQLYKPNLTVGVLGGMGPYATLAFFEKILHLSPAKKDWEHLHLIIDNNPHIPSRSRAYLYKEESPVKSMIESCKKLENYPVDIIAIPCNSAMHFLNPVKEKINVPILNIIEITSKQLKKKLNPGKKIAVLGGIITYSEKLYKPFLEKEGFIFVDHEEVDQSLIVSHIEDIKKNGIANISDFKNFINKYILIYQPDAIILGCTEFSYLLDVSDSVNSILIDSNTELASYVVGLAYKKNDD
jgi:aspartate racemase